MRNFINQLTILLCGLFIIAAGYYLVFKNLNFLVGDGDSNWQFRWKSDGLIVKTGKWVEVVKWQPPVKIIRHGRIWVFQSNQITVLASTAPKFRIQWKRTPFH